MGEFGREKVIRPYNDHDIYKTTEQQSDKHLYADDVTIKINNIDEIYRKLTTFGQIGNRYIIKINWGKVLIIAR